MLKIYNTFSKKKEHLVLSKKIIIYVCGITVYDYCHIGHARGFLFFDAFVRYLKFLNIKVVFIRNITDIDDKILDRAKKLNKSFKFVTQKFIKKMHLDISDLNLIEPSFEPKATVFINKIIDLVLYFKNNGYAYIDINNDVYFSVRKVDKYGILSNRFLGKKQLLFLNQTTSKLEKEDFVIWKSDLFFKKWKSFLGYGRPGWHTECAAMSVYYSENGVDIHSGGIDLLFPHHENEMVQTKVLNNFDLVKTWMHIGQLKFQRKKMSKSLNNFVLIKDFLSTYNEEYLRFFLFFTHYRKSVNFSDDLLKRTNKILDGFYELLLNLDSNVDTINVVFKKKFLDSMNDDLNIFKAISVLFEVSKKIKKNKCLKTAENQELIYTIKFLGNIIGLFKYEPAIFFKKKIVPKSVLNLVKKRNIARVDANWDLADKIRLKINNLGFRLKDTCDSTLIDFIT